jgi:hypothetical protein
MKPFDNLTCFPRLCNSFYDPDSLNLDPAFQVNPDPDTDPGF